MGGDGEAATRVGKDAAARVGGGGMRRRGLGGGGMRRREWGGAAARMRCAARSFSPERVRHAREGCGGGVGIAQLACIFGIIFFLGELVADSSPVWLLFELFGLKKVG
jgi:hypothetical protein